MPDLEDYRLLLYFQTEKHVERMSSYCELVEDLRVADPGTYRYLQMFLHREAQLKIDHDMLSQRLRQRIEDFDTDA